MFATDVSTTCAEAIFRVKMAFQQVVETSVANNSPSKDSNHPDDVFNQCMLLLGSKHFLNQNHLRVTITPISGISNSVSNMGAALRIPRVFPRESCNESAEAIQSLHPALKLATKVNKHRAMPAYVPWGKLPGMVADKCKIAEVKFWPL